MCVDYTNLNKACPKDPFGLPRIDLVVDSTAGCETLCFLDAYSGYHQVSLAESDCIKTSFITPFGAFCYSTIVACRYANTEDEGHPLFGSAEGVNTLQTTTPINNTQILPRFGPLGSVIPYILLDCI